jgi:hypothetical protein
VIGPKTYNLTSVAQVNALFKRLTDKLKVSAAFAMYDVVVDETARSDGSVLTRCVRLVPRAV